MQREKAGADALGAFRAWAASWGGPVGRENEGALPSEFPSLPIFPDTSSCLGSITTYLGETGKHRMLYVRMVAARPRPDLGRNNPTAKSKLVLLLVPEERSVWTDVVAC